MKEQRVLVFSFRCVKCGFITRLPYRPNVRRSPCPKCGGYMLPYRRTAPRAHTESLYVRYKCVKDEKHLYIREHCARMPKMLLCDKCDGYMLPGRPTVLLEKDKKLLMEPGIDWGARGTLWISVEQVPPSRCGREYGQITIDARRGIRLRRCREARTGRWITQSVLFRKDGGWTNSSIRQWLARNRFIVREVTMPQQIPSILRKILNNSVGLFYEWLEIYIQVLSDGYVDTVALLVVWARFREKYIKTKGGRWTLRN